MTVRKACLLHYEREGTRYTWLIDAHPTRDTEETFKAHLAKWVPNAKLIGYEFEGEARKEVEG